VVQHDMVSRPTATQVVAQDSEANRRPARPRPTLPQV
jgi:hypothetical protein